MILRFTASNSYLALNTENHSFTISKRIVADYDEMRHFMPHVYRMIGAFDIGELMNELIHQGYTKTDESYVFYDGNDTCTEFVTDDLPFC